ncbi:PH and SEC7 domain-containing protein-like [Ischnura elegans]|uniref:PH and SEC7 domain-containing protein-like n=1 Tax=Ischnura elegans TaxID=197161 RepID=UPI001ED8B6E0|nr:PH and SEC7 domain-containing protein-like [Ischnura elegans]
MMDMDGQADLDEEEEEDLDEEEDEEGGRDEDDRGVEGDDEGEPDGALWDELEVEAGDVILEVNSKDVYRFSTKEVLKCLRLSGDTVTLKLKRDPKIKARVLQYLSVGGDANAFNVRTAREEAPKARPSGPNAAPSADAVAPTPAPLPPDKEKKRRRNTSPPPADTPECTPRPRPETAATNQANGSVEGRGKSKAVDGETSSSSSSYARCGSRAASEQQRQREEEEGEAEEDEDDGGGVGGGSGGDVFAEADRMQWEPMTSGGGVKFSRPAQPRFEAYMMTGDLILNLSRTQHGAGVLPCREKKVDSLLRYHAPSSPPPATCGPPLAAAAARAPSASVPTSPAESELGLKSKRRKKGSGSGGRRRDKGGGKGGGGGSGGKGGGDSDGGGGVGPSGGGPSASGSSGAAAASAFAFVRTSRSEDHLQLQKDSLSTTVDIDIDEDVTSSLNTLLDTRTDAPPPSSHSQQSEGNPASSPPNGSSRAEPKSERIVWTYNDPASPTTAAAVAASGQPQQSHHHHNGSSSSGGGSSGSSSASSSSSNSSGSSSSSNSSGSSSSSSSASSEEGVSPHRSFSPASPTSVSSSVMSSDSSSKRGQAGAEQGSHPSGGASAVPGGLANGDLSQSEATVSNISSPDFREEAETLDIVGGRDPLLLLMEQSDPSDSDSTILVSDREAGRRHQQRQQQQQQKQLAQAHLAPANGASAHSQKDHHRHHHRHHHHHHHHHKGHRKHHRHQKRGAATTAEEEDVGCLGDDGGVEGGDRQHRIVIKVKGPEGVGGSSGVGVGAGRVEGVGVVRSPSGGSDDAGNNDMLGYQELRESEDDVPGGVFLGVREGEARPIPPTSPPLSEDDSDMDSLHSFHYSPKAVDIPSAFRLAKRLYTLDGFKKSDVSRHLSKNNDFSRVVAEEYLKYFSFDSDTLDVALRKFLKQFCLTGETQERERVLVHFSKRYLDCNPGSFNSQDAVHTLTCAIMLLNTDLHGQNIGRKMTCSEFIENLSELNDGENFPREVLKLLYHAIKTQPLEWALDDDSEDGNILIMHPGKGSIDGQTQGTGDRGGGMGGGGNSGTMGMNPFLDVPNAATAVEYKKGYVMRKSCMDPNGKKTPFGKRGWKMFYCTLRDLVLYLHKDEHGFRRGREGTAMYESFHNAVRVHHALATKAADYTKKQHVFRLQTADQAEYLFQTSDSKELQSWIDTINFVAASFSAQPLASAVGSQRKFQRPLLPCSHTKLNLREQLRDHEDRVQRLEAELDEHRRHPPDRGAKSLSVQNYREKDAFLHFELKRYKTYAYLLRSKMAQYPELEPSLVEGSIGEGDERVSELVVGGAALSDAMSSVGAGPGAVGAALVPPPIPDRRSPPATNRYSYRAAIYNNRGEDIG